ncbi:MAG: chloride channel protein [Pseudomonadota bacterium]
MPLGFRTFRRSLSRYDAAVAYAVLGIVAGLLSGAVVIAFEHGIEQAALLWGVGERGDGFEALSLEMRILLPVVGALVLGLGFTLLRPEDREVGIVHVISRLHGSYGMLPWRNAVVQFVGGVLALATGQSGGREGPGVHLGAAINSLIGQLLQLPNNSLRILIACGSAGGIAAAFNTPLAGVIFAMEVVISEYSVAGFMPVMLAAISASVLSEQYGGGSEIFDLAGVQLQSVNQLPVILAVGIACGIAAGLFIRMSTVAARLATWPLLLRFGFAGLVVAALGSVLPETLGMGYDTLDSILFAEQNATLLISIAGAKILATAVAIGVGMPIGLIGPNLLLGACVGGFVGSVVLAVFPGAAVDTQLCAAVGMAATMGAVFAAPLAASLALIELTQSTSIAVPALLAIIAAHLINLTAFRQKSAHRSVLRQLRRQVPDDPFSQLLHRTDVNTVLDRSVVVIGDRVTPAVAHTLAVQVPNWCLVRRKGEGLFLVQGKELVDWIEELAQEPVETELDVTESSLRRWSIREAPEQATLHQALDILRRHTVEAVCIYARVGRSGRELRGVVTRDRIERFTLDRFTT